jgi:DNA invertase Pin-like site-specific DNA recombinase
MAYLSYRDRDSPGRFSLASGAYVVRAIPQNPIHAGQMWCAILGALLDYAREGDAIVVVGIDRLGRNAAEVMMTIRDLTGRGVVLRSLREGIDRSNAAGRMVAGVLASLAELELELGKERRSASRDARRARGQAIWSPQRSGCLQCRSGAPYARRW